MTGRGRARGRGRGAGAQAPGAAPASAPGVRPPGAAPGVRPPASAPGVRPPGAAPGVRPPGAAPGVRPPGAAAGTQPVVGRGGRGRGRGSGSTAPVAPSAAPAAPASVPGASAGPSTIPGSAGRGVVRGASTAAQPGPAQVQQVTEGMSAMTVRRGTGRYFKSNDSRYEAQVALPPGERHGGQKADDAPKSFLVNYFAMTYTRSNAIFKYRVDFAPEVDNPRMRAFLVRSAVEEQAGKEVQFAFMETEMFIAHGTLMDRNVKTRDESVYTVKFSAMREIPYNSPEIFVVLNSIFRKSLGKMGLTKVQRHYYNMERREVVSERQNTLTILPGYETAIGRYQNNQLLLNVDLASRVLRQDTVADVMSAQLRAARSAQDAERIMNNLKDELTGQVVLTKYNDKTYTIADIDFTISPRDTFDKRGEEISFVDYFRSAYQHEISNPGMRGMLVAKLSNRDRNRKVAQQTSSRPQDEKPVLLVPELCNMTGLSDSMRRDFNLMKAVANITNKQPRHLAQKLKDFIHDLQQPGSESKKNLDGWGVGFERQMLKVEGRVLHKNYCGQPPSLLMGNPRHPLPFGVDDFMRELRGQPVHGPKQINNWLFIFARGLGQVAQTFAGQLSQSVQRMGIQISGRPVMVETGGVTASHFTEKIRQNTGGSAGQFQIVVCLLERENSATYKAIKQLCYGELSMPSQVVTKRAATKGMSVATKVGIQMNCKLGGEMWRVHIPQNSGILVCGYDTYHSGPRTNQRSYGVLVSSINPAMTQYYAQSFANRPGEEMSFHLRAAITTALRKYVEFNGAGPKHLVLYRDGLGDGMLGAFAEIELQEINAAVREFEGPTIGLAVVIVKKRISTRILSVEGNDVRNPEPGSIVDGVITRPNWYDFYLISQTARQGTVSPTHYNVVYDSSNLPARIMQSLTYRLTHLYYNWTGAISIPAPCQYAHKLAFICGDIMTGPFSLALSDKLFYL